MTLMSILREQDMTAQRAVCVSMGLLWMFLMQVNRLLCLLGCSPSFHTLPDRLPGKALRAMVP